MLDIRLLREHPERVRADLERRGDQAKLKILEELLKQDANWRLLRQQANDLRKRRNEVSKEIDSLKRAGKDAGEALAEAKSIPDQIKAIEAKADVLLAQSRQHLLRLPNLLDPAVPVGADASQNKVVRKFGSPQKPAFPLKPHGDFLQEAGLADFVRGAKVAGHGFYFLLGDLALLENALTRFALDSLAAKGFKAVQPPFMISRQAYEGVTDLADFENVMYKVEGEDLFLIATSEHAIGAMLRDEILEESTLPLKFAGVSPCFRREIGAHGVDTKGLFRVHQFNKVEQFVFCKPEDSPRIHEELLVNAEELFQKLGLPYQIVLICTGDIGTVAAKKYDLEVWMPREQAYSEAVSCSNCTSYQAVRSNIKFRKKDGEKEYAHTLNSTAIATSRVLRAIVENYVDEKGNIQVPTVLQPYLNGLKEIKRGKPI